MQVCTLLACMKSTINSYTLKYMEGVCCTMFIWEMLLKCFLSKDVRDSCIHLAVDQKLYILFQNVNKPNTSAAPVPIETPAAAGGPSLGPPHVLALGPTSSTPGASSVASAAKKPDPLYPDLRDLIKTGVLEPGNNVLSLNTPQVRTETVMFSQSPCQGLISHFSAGPVTLKKNTPPQK